MKIAIRMVEFDDYEQEIKEAKERLLPEGALYDSWWWGAFFKKGRSLGDPVGFGGMCSSHSFRNVAYLSFCAVEPEFRGLAIQRRLIRARTRYAKRMGYEFVVTDTCMNPASANNLIACGFRMYTPQNPWGLYRSVYWKKEL